MLLPAFNERNSRFSPFLERYKLLLDVPKLVTLLTLSTIFLGVNAWLLLKYNLPSSFTYNLPPSPDATVLGSVVSPRCILPVISKDSSGFVIPIPSFPSFNIRSLSLPSKQNLI